ncbi:hypothetical protein J2T57_004201 [Natronocella acetinitrilica]|uniref:Uncharacterized protein n=1 Tax=Natronocella acetinitrilica TaxID=414046 RepID=A0AAE3G7S6_9GAMM|nr:hypothetical protein [Natronocella acetinitrilica]MCP1677027.1 hypothetical protein [Natronocella acetinitrilica]
MNGKKRTLAAALIAMLLTGLITLSGCEEVDDGDFEDFEEEGGDDDW